MPLRVQPFPVEIEVLELGAGFRPASVFESLELVQSDESERRHQRDRHGVADPPLSGEAPFDAVLVRLEGFGVEGAAWVGPPPASVPCTNSLPAMRDRRVFSAECEPQAGTSSRSIIW